MIKKITVKIEEIRFVLKHLPVAFIEILKYLYVLVLCKRIYEGFVEFDNIKFIETNESKFLSFKPTYIKNIPFNVSALLAGDKIYDTGSIRYIDIPVLKFKLKKNYFIFYEGKKICIYMHKKDILEFKLKN